jgi:hypothetical protein
VTDQSSIIHFIEDNWLSGQRIGNGSFDGIANSIVQMFNFKKVRTNGTLCLSPSTGERENRLLCGLERSKVFQPSAGMQNHLHARRFLGASCQRCKLKRERRLWKSHVEHLLRKVEWLWRWWWAKGCPAAPRSQI